jgi:hypothetical protein
MANVLEEGTKEVCCRSIFVGKNFHLLKFIMSWLAVYGGNVTAIQHMYKWCREFDSCRLNVKDEKSSGQPYTSADPVQGTDAALQTDRCVNTAHLELRFNL